MQTDSTTVSIPGLNRLKGMLKIFLNNFLLVAVSGAALTYEDSMKSH